MEWQERTNKLTSEFTGNAGENSVTMPNGVHIVSGSGYQSLERTHTSSATKYVSYIYNIIVEYQKLLTVTITQFELEGSN